VSELSKALAAVYGDVHRIPKRGRNDFHRYDYMTEGDLVDVLRPLLSAHGLSVVSSIDSVERYVPEGTREGKGTDPITRVRMSFTIRHAGGESVGPLVWFGEGQDRGDKGIYKATTGCVKYFMFKQFLVSTGDDPENDDEPRPRVRIDPAPAPAPATAPAPAPAPDTDLAALLKQQWAACIAHYGSAADAKMNLRLAVGDKDFRTYTAEDAAKVADLIKSWNP
jgi:hypothetical protein